MYSSVLTNVMGSFDFYSHVFTTPPPALDDSSDSDYCESPFSPVDPVTPVDPPSSPLLVEFVGEWSDTLTQPPGGVEAEEDVEKTEDSSGSSSASSSASISAGGLGCGMTGMVITYGSTNHTMTGSTLGSTQGSTPTSATGTMTGSTSTSTGAINASGSTHGTGYGSTHGLTPGTINTSGAMSSPGSTYHTVTDSTQGTNGSTLGSTHGSTHGSTSGSIPTTMYGSTSTAGTMTGTASGSTTSATGSTNGSTYHGSTQDTVYGSTSATGTLNATGSTYGSTSGMSATPDTAGTVSPTSRASILAAFQYSPSSSTAIPTPPPVDTEISSLFESPICSTPPAFPTSLYAVKDSDFPGIFDNYQTALNHAADKSNVILFSCMESAAMYMSHADYKVYRTSDNLKVLAKSCIYNVFTDGSFTGGYDKGSGYGGIGVWFGENHPDNVAAQMVGPEKCSQQAELEALLEAYKIIFKRHDKRTYEIYCDCQSAINLVNMPYLVHSRFKETVERIHTYKNAIPATCTVYLTRILGHNGNPGNERAHYLANMGRQGDHGRHFPCVNGALRDNMDNVIYGLRAKYL